MIFVVIQYIRVQSCLGIGPHQSPLTRQPRFTACENTKRHGRACTSKLGFVKRLDASYLRGLEEDRRRVPRS